MARGDVIYVGLERRIEAVFPALERGEDRDRRFPNRRLPEEVRNDPGGVENSQPPLIERDRVPQELRALDRLSDRPSDRAEGGLSAKLVAGEPMQVGEEVGNAGRAAIQIGPERRGRRLDRPVVSGLHGRTSDPIAFEPVSIPVSGLAEVMPDPQRGVQRRGGIRMASPDDRQRNALVALLDRECGSCFRDHEWGRIDSESLDCIGPLRVESGGVPVGPQAREPTGLPFLAGEERVPERLGDATAMPQAEAARLLLLEGQPEPVREPEREHRHGRPQPVPHVAVDLPDQAREIPGATWIQVDHPGVGPLVRGRVAQDLEPEGDLRRVEDRGRGGDEMRRDLAGEVPVVSDLEGCVRRAGLVCRVDRLLLTIPDREIEALAEIAELLGNPCPAGLAGFEGAGRRAYLRRVSSEIDAVESDDESPFPGRLADPGRLPRSLAAIGRRQLGQEVAVLDPGMATRVRGLRGPDVEPFVEIPGERGHRPIRAFVMGIGLDLARRVPDRVARSVEDLHRAGEGDEVGMEPFDGTHGSTAAGSRP